MLFGLLFLSLNNLKVLKLHKKKNSEKLLYRRKFEMKTLNKSGIA